MPAVPWGVGRVAVLGLDPGTWKIGVVALGWHGELLDWLEWRVPANTGTEDRLAMVRDGLRLLIRELRPAAVAYELGTGQYSAAALDVLLRRIPDWCEAAGVPSAGYRPTSWRKTVCGDGGLSKEGAWDALRIGYPDFRRIAEKDGDARDAYGVGMCWLMLNRNPVLTEITDAMSKGNAIRLRRGR